MTIEYSKVKDAFLSEYLKDGTQIHIERIYQNDPRIQVKTDGHREIWHRVPDEICEIDKVIDWYIENFKDCTVDNRNKTNRTEIFFR
ncbi:MAG: hypothetical protein GY841_15675 [FCB group bacterium]|nr:hypothetical protein [FCB group bacterium]